MSHIMPYFLTIWCKFKDHKKQLFHDSWIIFMPSNFWGVYAVTSALFFEEMIFLKEIDFFKEFYQRWQMKAILPHE